MRCDLKVEKEVGVEDRRKQENSSKGARNERDEAYWDIYQQRKWMMSGRDCLPNDQRELLIGELANVHGGTAIRLIEATFE